MRLSDMQCRTAKTKATTYKLFDGGGLYLEVHVNGSKYWRQKYQFLSKERRIAHGKYPDVSLLQAREKREQIKKLLIITKLNSIFVIVENEAEALQRLTK